MRLIDRYLLRELALPLAACLAVALLSLLIERLLRVLDIVLDARGPLGSVLEMLTYLVPHYIGLALPIAFFLSVYVAFSRLNRDSEFDVFQASGINLLRLLRPALAVALVMAALAFLVFGYLQPLGRYSYRAEVHALRSAAELAFLEAGVFYHFKKASFIADRVAADGKRFESVFVFREEEDGTRITISARQAEVAVDFERGKTVVRLLDGIHVRERPGTGGGEARYDLLLFDDVRESFDSSHYTAFRARGIDERELTFDELFAAQDTPPPEVRPEEVASELNERLARAASMLILPFLAAPLALGHRRSQRGFGLVMGLAVLIADHELLQFAASLADRGGVAAWFGLWIPPALLALVAGMLFHRAAFGVSLGSGAPGSQAVDAILERVQRLRPRRRSAA